MPRVCTVCTHDARQSIDKALVSGTPYRRIAQHHSVSENALYRHHDEHLPARIVKAQERADVREAINIVEQLKLVNAAALHVLKQARESRDGELMLKASDRILKQVELQAKLLGELDDRPQINILVAPEWLELRVVILNALSAYPEAQRDVVEALADVRAS